MQHLHPKHLRTKVAAVVLAATAALAVGSVAAAAIPTGGFSLAPIADVVGLTDVIDTTDEVVTPVSDSGTVPDGVPASDDSSASAGRADGASSAPTAGAKAPARKSSAPMATALPSRDSAGAGQALSEDFPVPSDCLVSGGVDHEPVVADALVSSDKTTSPDGEEVVEPTPGENCDDVLQCVSMYSPQTASAGTEDSVDDATVTTDDEVTEPACDWGTPGPTKCWPTEYVGTDPATGETVYDTICIPGTIIENPDAE